MTTTYQQYKLTTADTLALFQFMEHALREYILECYKFIARSVPQPVSFRFEAKDLERDTLGTLVKKARRLYRVNDDLLVRIEKIVGERNRCAHRSFFHFVEDTRDQKYAEKHLVEMKALHKRAHTLLHEFLPRWQEICDANNNPPTKA